MRNPFPETPDTYLARAKAVHKIGLGHTTALDQGRAWPTLGEFLHAADVSNA